MLLQLASIHFSKLRRRPECDLDLSLRSEQYAILRHAAGTQDQSGRSRLPVRLGWSDSMLGYVVDVGVVPIEHLQTFLAPLSGLSLTAPVGGW